MEDCPRILSCYDNQYLKTPEINRLTANEGVGRIRQHIEQHGLADNTIIWFISDNEGPAKNMTLDELYNLADDPRETKDLSDQYPEKGAEISKMLRAMFENALSDSPHD